MADQKRALVLASFKDAGTGKSYAKGETRLIETAIFANYEAAGLVGAAPARAKAAAKPKPKAKGALKAKSASGTAKTEPAPVVVPDPASAEAAVTADL